MKSYIMSQVNSIEELEKLQLISQKIIEIESGMKLTDDEASISNLVPKT
ncbi:MAG: hypothetical protein ACQESK_03345 [Bacteroidota bacterium]